MALSLPYFEPFTSDKVQAGAAGTIMPGCSLI
jgi:hypothetical protein